MSYTVSKKNMSFTVSKKCMSFVFENVNALYGFEKLNELDDSLKRYLIMLKPFRKLPLGTEEIKTKIHLNSR